MSSDENPERMKPFHGWLTWLGVFAALFVLASAAFFTWRAKLSNDVDRKLAQIRSAGFPTNSSEWGKYYETPENAVTGLWRDAVGVQGSGPLSGADFGAAVQGIPMVSNNANKVPPPGMPWLELDEAKELLATYKDSMDKMHEATRQGGAARFPRNAKAGFAMQLPEIGPLRSGANMLALEAHVRAHEKDRRGAAESIHAVFMLAKSVENEPTLISWLVHVAIHSVGVELIKALLPHVEFSEDDLRRLQKDLRASDNPKLFVKVIAGERAMGIEAMRNPAGAAMPVESTNPWGATNEDLLCFLEHSDLMVAAAGEGWPRAFELAKQAELTLKDRLQNKPLAKVRYLITAQILPATIKTFEATGRHLANCRAADAAIAVELFCRKNGHLPKTLDELVPDFLPAVPLDPFDGKPLRFRIDGAGCVIYSIGRDRIDNHGVEQPIAVDEIVFRLEKKSE